MFSVASDVAKGRGNILDFMREDGSVIFFFLASCPQEVKDGNNQHFCLFENQC